MVARIQVEQAIDRAVQSFKADLARIFANEATAHPIEPTRVGPNFQAKLATALPAAPVTHG